MGPEEGLVVRKQPPGKLLKGAHDVGREFAAMSSLRDTAVPVPNARLYCEDTDLLGTKFFCYDFVPGRFFQDPYLSNIKDLEERRAIYDEYARTASKLHSVKPSEVPGLEALGKGGGYLARQVKTWSAQYPNRSRRRRICPTRPWSASWSVAAQVARWCRRGRDGAESTVTSGSTT